MEPAIGSWSRDGLTFRFRDYAGPSDRPPLLCLHGLTRNSRDFEDFAARVAGRFRVIAPDFRGRGLSDHDPDSSRYVPPTYAADVLQLLDELGIDRAIFVGTSLGGLVTMLVAAVQPERIAGTILNDVGPELDTRGLDRIRTYVGGGEAFADWNEAAARVAEINGQVPTEANVGDWIARARRLCRECGSTIVFDYDPAIAEPFAAPADAPAPDMWPLFRQLSDKPLLIVRGERSDLLSPDVADAMVAQSAAARLVTVPGVGHAPELSEAEAVAAIDAFLDQFAACGDAALGAGPA